MDKIKVNDKVVSVEDQHETFEIWANILNIDGGSFSIPIQVHWYKYKDNSKTTKPFAAFFNNDICFFANKKEDISFNKLNNYSKNIITFFAAYSLKNTFSNVGNNTICVPSGSLKTDIGSGKLEEVRIKYKIGSEAGYEIEYPADGFDDIPTVNITLDGTQTQTQALISFLKEEYYSKFKEEIKEVISDMKLKTCIEDIYFEEPNSLNWFNYSKEDEKELYATQGVFGTTYRLSQKAQSYYLDGKQRDKCVLILSPQYLLMDPINRKSLLVHELSHVYCGLNHAHDSYFWSVYEQHGPCSHFDTTCSRTDDLSYNKYVEQEDTEYFDENYATSGYSVEECIEKEKQLQSEFANWIKS